MSLHQSNTLFPELIPEDYKWKQISPTGFQRPALAGEMMWAHRPKEYHQMYLYTSLTLSTPLSSLTLRITVAEAWMQLRRETPDMGIVARNVDDRVLMQFEMIKEEDQLLEWCDGSLNFASEKESRGFDRLRKQVVESKQGKGAGQQAVLLIVTDDTSEMTGRIELMLNVEHQIMDGIGIRILMSKFLDIFASRLSISPDQVVPDTQEESLIPRPSEPWICLMNQNQVISGSEYEAAVEYNRKVLLEEMPKNPGLPTLSTREPGTQKNHNITLSESRSAKIIGAIKDTIDPEANITHLAHAAMVLALIRYTSKSLITTTSSNSPDITLYSPCWINGRRYLQNSELTSTYLPICQTFAPIVFHNLQDLAIDKDSSDSELKEILIKTARTATKEYMDIKQRQSIMPESVKLMEYLGTRMGQSKKAPDTHTKGTKPITAGPLLLSDGKMKNYIAHHYLDAFEVDEVQFAANAEGPNLIVRLSSWRGKVSILGEWRSCDYEEEMVVGFLEDVVWLMGLISVDC